MPDIPALVERQLANLADDWRLLGKTPEEIADLVAFNRPRLTERAQNSRAVRVRFRFPSPRADSWTRQLLSTRACAQTKL